MWVWLLIAVVCVGGRGGGRGCMGAFGVREETNADGC